MSTNAPFLTKTFSRLKEINRLGHGYLFFGESTAARNNFTRSILFFLERGNWDTDSTLLLDGREIKPACRPGGRLATGSAGRPEDGSIGIDAAREVISFLSLRPTNSAHRAIAITDAERLTREAQNALLKIVEEPPPYGIILLSARDPGLLLPTLVSRLARIHVSALADLIIAPVDAKLAENFLAGAPQVRKTIIKALTALEDKSSVNRFIAALAVECRKDLPRRHALLKELLHRNAAMARWSTNRKLQLESLLTL